MMTLKNYKCLAIIGRAGSGKDTLAKYINEYLFGTTHCLYLCNLKFSDPLKNAVCEIFGWDRRKIDELEYKEEQLNSPYRVWKYNRREDALFDKMPLSLNTRREILQYVGTDVFRSLDPDIWVKAALRDAAETADVCEVTGFVSTDCRFPNEQEGLVKTFGKTLFVRLHRQGEKQNDTHTSEKIDLLHADMEFRVANGDLQRLREIAKLVANDFFPELVKES